MEYRKIGDNYYIRMDRGDEIIGNLLSICEKESIPSAVFSGIGGCQSAELQVFIPERLRVGERSSGMTGSFETEQLEGMLELVSLNGNVVRDDDGKLFHHTHALFSFMRGNMAQRYAKILSHPSHHAKIPVYRGFKWCIPSEMLKPPKSGNSWNLPR